MGIRIVIVAKEMSNIVATDIFHRVPIPIHLVAFVDVSAGMAGFVLDGFDILDGNRVHEVFVRYGEDL